MSTPEQPDTPPLTRRQLRDLRNIGATPVIAPETDAPEPAPVAPLPRAAEPVIVAAAPVSDVSVDLGVAPLTRRQARQQERIRTASVPVITPEVVAAQAAQTGTGEASVPVEATPHETATAALRDLFAPPAAGAATDAAPLAERTVTAREAFRDKETPTGALRDLLQPPASEPAAPSDDVAPAVDERPADLIEDAGEPASTKASADADRAAADDTEQERAVVSPLFGAGVIAGAAATPGLAASFDQLLSRPGTGALGTSNALILQSAGDSPIVGPVTATGEVLITGTFNLPEGLGSTGVAPGSTDGKEIDATLVDGELPAHSSPTPIAASAAISTVKSAGEVIRPPAPEKGSRLMLTLAITAGALGLALVGVLIIAFWTGALS